MAALIVTGGCAAVGAWLVTAASQVALLSPRGVVTGGAGGAVAFLTFATGAVFLLGLVVPLILIVLARHVRRRRGARARF